MNTDYTFIKNEIAFFMEKSFQFSFVYVGSFFAIIAGSKLEIMMSISKSIDADTDILTIFLLLILNFIYLTLSSSCLFAILKRGYFILENKRQANDNEYYNWEKFVRIPTSKIKFLSWNIDNYYMIILSVMIWILSFYLVFVGFKNTEGVLTIFLFFITALFLIPFWNSINTLRLNQICHSRIKDNNMQK